eukprot:CAMPEP_0174309466 /NCGR_PEP_ID=MMETSP0810-20121108/2430_1 /TAXON_ID=73025 ORGANISM="Eutreptiella gymnastica-like, Strain CCMP1594" /NCGR_SAMPLE_ID=MMETSP0810 /ASSEMBLY_ACC=CAM_ASM_000659 /LENGTH=31 /DNA_ID= /DNA_START= /DNA_END= /DNA_ORIENTATION=
MGVPYALHCALHLLAVWYGRYGRVGVAIKAK